MTIVKSCWHNFTQSAYFMIFFVSSISYRPTDLSLLKEFSKNVSFSNSYKLPSQSALQKLAMSTDYPTYETWVTDKQTYNKTRFSHTQSLLMYVALEARYYHLDRDLISSSKWNAQDLIRRWRGK